MQILQALFPSPCNTNFLTFMLQLCCAGWWALHSPSMVHSTVSLALCADLLLLLPCLHSPSTSPTGNSLTFASVPNLCVLGNAMSHTHEAFVVIEIMVMECMLFGTVIKHSVTLLKTTRKCDLWCIPLQTWEVFMAVCLLSTVHYLLSYQLNWDGLHQQHMYEYADCCSVSKLSAIVAYCCSGIYNTCIAFYFATLTDLWLISACGGGSHSVICGHSGLRSQGRRWLCPHLDGW